MNFLGALKFLYKVRISTICNKSVLKFFILSIALSRSHTIMYKWRPCVLLSLSPRRLKLYISYCYNRQYNLLDEWYRLMWASCFMMLHCSNTFKHTAVYIIPLASGINQQIFYWYNKSKMSALGFFLGW